MLINQDTVLAGNCPNPPAPGQEKFVFYNT